MMELRSDQDRVFEIAYLLFGFDCRELCGTQWDNLMSIYYAFRQVHRDTQLDAACCAFKKFSQDHLS